MWQVGSGGGLRWRCRCCPGFPAGLVGTLPDPGAIEWRRARPGGCLAAGERAWERVWLVHQTVSRLQEVAEGERWTRSSKNGGRPRNSAVLKWAWGRGGHLAIPKRAPSLSRARPRCFKNCSTTSNCDQLTGKPCRAGSRRRIFDGAHRRAGATPKLVIKPAGAESLRPAADRGRKPQKFSRVSTGAARRWGCGGCCAPTARALLEC